MPVAFWADPDQNEYRHAYLDKYPGVWAYGDFAEVSDHGGMIIYGRPDTVLNPGGVGIGTAEIYRQVEGLPEVLESLAVGQLWQGDKRIVAFFRLPEGRKLDDSLNCRIRTRIRANTTARHVPAKIIQVADIPRTRNNKIAEMAVRSVIHQQPVKNIEALYNPETLACFRDIPELSTP